jgi:hypothetical protein
MPGADASQFTQLKKANAVAAGKNAGSPDGKSVNRLTQYVIPLSAAVSFPDSGPASSIFLPSLTLKDITPLFRFRLNQGAPPSRGIPPCY